MDRRRHRTRTPARTSFRMAGLDMSAGGDGLISSISSQNRNWDGVWELRVRRTPADWTLEVRIPLRYS